MKRENPVCLCHHRWYKILFDKNPLLINRCYWIGWVDPEAWLEWWHFGVSPRIYYWKRSKWISFPFLGWRDKQIWDYDNPVILERPPKDIIDDDTGRST